MSISHLPPELLLHIFSYLVSQLYRGVNWPHWLAFSQVCSKWRTIALQDPSLWTCLDFPESMAIADLKRAATRNKGSTSYQTTVSVSLEIVRRSLELPLALQSSAPFYCNDIMFTAYVHAHRLWALVLAFNSDHIGHGHFSLLSEVSFPALQILDFSLERPEFSNVGQERRDFPQLIRFGDAPSLRYLNLNNCYLQSQSAIYRPLTSLILERTQGLSWSPLDLMNMLSQTRELRELRLLHISLVVDDDDIGIQGTPKTNLSSLRVLFLCDDAPTCVYLLQRLQFPPNTRVSVEGDDYESWEPNLQRMLFRTIESHLLWPNKEVGRLKWIVRDYEWQVVQAWRGVNDRCSPIFHADIPLLDASEDLNIPSLLAPLETSVKTITVSMPIWPLYEYRTHVRNIISKANLWTRRLAVLTAVEELILDGTLAVEEFFRVHAEQDRTNILFPSLANIHIQHFRASEDTLEVQFLWKLVLTWFRDRRVAGNQLRSLTFDRRCRLTYQQLDSVLPLVETVFCDGYIIDPARHEEWPSFIVRPSEAEESKELLVATQRVGHSLDDSDYESESAEESGANDSDTQSDWSYESGWGETDE